MKSGHFEGRGKFIWPDGTYIESNNFRRDEVMGEGTKVWADGSRYQGDFKSGWMTGRGTRWYKNGEKYEGQWRRNTRMGQGTLFGPGGNVIKRGRWEFDSFKG